MRFAIITPASGLQRFATLSKTHLLLAHVTNPLYWKFYQKLAEDPTQLIILDNSAYEHKMDTRTVLERLEFLGRCDALVIPDLYAAKSVDNFRLAVEFIKQYRHSISCDLMYCPQFNGDWEDFVDMRTFLEAMVTDFGIRWFGLPRHIAERGYSRAELCLSLKRMRAAWSDSQPYVHALGMCAGNLREFEELDTAQCDSIDSSAPVWRGWKGFDIEAYREWDLNGCECDFNARPESLTPENEFLILKNLRKVGISC